MHTTHMKKRGLADGANETLVIKQQRLGNLFPIEAQIALAAMFDKRKTRRKMKAARKARNWKED